MSVEAVTIVGGGFVGGSGACHFALAGVKATIFDVDQKIVDCWNRGESPVVGLKNYLGFDFGVLVTQGLLKATTSWDEVKKSDIWILAVPTEKDGEPYSEIILSVVRKLAAEGLPKGVTIIIESTLEPGVEQEVQTTLAKGLGMAGEDYYLVIAPRRDWFVSAAENLRTCTRIMAGVTQWCTQRGREILSIVSRDVRTASDYRVPSVVKAFENSLLHVMVVYAQDLADAFQHLPFDEVLELAGTHWRLPTLHLPGARTSGYCVPSGSRYLRDAASRAGRRAKIAEDVIATDDQHPKIVAQVIEKNTGRPARVLVLGISYKPGFKVPHFSAGATVAKCLKQMGIEVHVCDPYFTPEEIKYWSGADAFDPAKIDSTMGLLMFDAVYLACPHKEFADVTRLLPKLAKGTYVMDNYGTWKDSRKLLELTEIRYAWIGGPGWMEAKPKPGAVNLNLPAGVAPVDLRAK